MWYSTHLKCVRGCRYWTKSTPGHRFIWWRAVRHRVVVWTQSSRPPQRGRMGTELDQMLNHFHLSRATVWYQMLNKFHASGAAASYNQCNRIIIDQMLNHFRLSWATVWYQMLNQFHLSTVFHLGTGSRISDPAMKLVGIPAVSRTCTSHCHCTNLQLCVLLVVL